ncbi:sigma-70 family RNA polymerase sigma factor [Streptomyces sp. NPDC006544]|uniref:sigma-70 family RNA polymerase sigma factor n=1 Tax=Streptomyces sp. NPDC006544 TaxID=3154583 RepID=UPI0033AD2264
MTTPTFDRADASTAAATTLDQDTLAELYRLHAPYLLRALLRMANGDRGKAEDILQETFLRAWQNPRALSRGPEHGRPWLFTVGRRIAIDHFRMAAARVKEVGDEAQDERADTLDPYDEVLAAHDVARSLRQLPPHQREVLVHLHFHDHTAARTGRALGVPTGTVKSRNFYAVRALAPLLEARGLAPVNHRSTRSR